MAPVPINTNKPDTTLIIIPQSAYSDKNITVTIDRKKGNPNRVCEVSYRGYETDGTVESASNGVIAVEKIEPVVAMKIKRLYNQNEQVEIGYTSKSSGRISVNVFDIMGRNIERGDYKVESGSNVIRLKSIFKTGIYFVVVSGEKESQTRKFAVVK